MNTRIWKIIAALVFALCAMLLALGSCAPQDAVQAPPAQTEAPAPEETAPTAGEPAQAIEGPAEENASVLPEEEPAVFEEAPEAEEAPAAAEVPAVEEAPAEEPKTLDMASMTPAERAAAWGLPAPPEGIDLSDREFKLANAYNSITDQRPNHSYGAGVVVDKVASAGFNAFVEAARAAGYYVTAYSGYVDYWTALENYYQPNVAAYGAEKASKITLVPGCNDHQTALGIDLRMGSADYESSKDFRGTEAWDWLLEHCAEYGVILRYPEGQEQWYGTACMHPCHFRYVGETAARYIMDNNITLEQFMLLYDWDIIYVPGVN